MGLGLVAFILYLWFFVGFDGLFTLLSQLNVYQYSLFVGLAVGALFAAVIFDSLIWKSLLNTLSVKVKFRKLFLYNWIGNFVELIIPSATIGGEVARIALAQKETKHDTGIAAATVIGSRIISTFVYSGGLLVGFLLLLFTHQLPCLSDYASNSGGYRNIPCSALHLRDCFQRRRSRQDSQCNHVGNSESHQEPHKAGIV